MRLGRGCVLESTIELVLVVYRVARPAHRVVRLPVRGFTFDAGNTNSTTYMYGQSGDQNSGIDAWRLWGRNYMNVVYRHLIPSSCSSSH